jgi:hypothetical protein
MDPGDAMVNRASHWVCGQAATITAETSRLSAKPQPQTVPLSPRLL